MMNLENEAPGSKLFTRIGSGVGVVISRRVDGWCAYIGTSGHENDSDEVLSEQVAAYGTKLRPTVARAFAETYFDPPINSGDLPYAG